MLRYLEDVVTLQLDVEACNGCGMCAIVCPHGVFDIQEGKAVIVDLNACIECGACAINCPVEAIRVQTGAGCASGVLLGLLGRDNECSSCCGVSPAVSESSQDSCCGDQIEKPKSDNGKSSCCS